MKLELEEGGLNVGVLDSDVVPRPGDQIHLGFPKLNDLPAGTVVFEVASVIYVGQNCGGSRAFTSPAPTRIVLNGRVLRTIQEA